MATDWRLLRGPERRPPEPDRDPQLRRIAAWLELVQWWQWAVAACVEPRGPRTSHLALKLVTEPVRVWLWLARGERVPDRLEALHRARRALPEEEAAIGRALALARALHRSPEPPLADVLPALVRLSARIASLIGDEIEAAGVTEVELVGADPAQLVHPEGGWEPLPGLAGARASAPLPLVDWRALTWSRMPDESLVPVPGDPGDPAALAVAGGRLEGPYPALRFGPLLVLASAVRWRTRLRALASPATDPVSFALVAGESAARFPNVAGWSVQDTARRAVAERGAWLESGAGQAGGDDRGRRLGQLLGAARAGLLAESVARGEPRLPVTARATVRLLAAHSSAAEDVGEQALEALRAYADAHVQPGEQTVLALREVVGALPVYAGTD